MDYLILIPRALGPYTLLRLAGEVQDATSPVDAVDQALQRIPSGEFLIHGAPCGTLLYFCEPSKN